MSNPTESAKVVRVAVPNPRRTKAQRIKMILRYERKKMACKQRDPIGRPTKMTVAAIVIQVEKGNWLPKEGVHHRARIEVDPKIEIGIDRGTDHEIDRGIDRETDRAIDHGTGIEGKLYESIYF